VIRNVDLVEDTAIVVKGEDIPSFTPRIWDWILRHRELVFARTTPEHKLRIVKVPYRKDIWNNNELGCYNAGYIFGQ